MATNATSSWWNVAACLTADPELFFPISSTGAGEAHLAKAKAVCSRCPIRQGCLDYAIDSHQAYGVWGGTSEDERRRMVTRRRRELERVPA